MTPNHHCLYHCAGEVLSQPGAKEDANVAGVKSRSDSGPPWGILGSILLWSIYTDSGTDVCLLCLASFTEPNVFMVHPCCSLCPNFIPLRLNDIPWIDHILLRGPLGHLHFSLLWVMLLWTWVCNYLFESLLAVLWGLYLEVEFLSQCTMCNLLKTIILFYTKGLYHFPFPPEIHKNLL